jgi:hypothetical protein
VGKVETTRVPPSNNQLPQNQPAPPLGVLSSNPTAPTPAQSASAASEQAKKPVNPNTTQNSLLISEIRDNMVIMKDGSFRSVIACQSINFDLMSSREREGVEFSYQNFLNSLYFPVQIFIRSQRVDIGPYLDRLVGIRRAQDNMLLNVLMDDYINFIDALAQEANIMDKSFFIIVPYFPAGDLNNLKEQATGFFGRIFAKPKTQTIKIDTVAFEKAKDEIKNRGDAVMSGLFQMGVKSVQLSTKELGELYYNVYNPDTAVREPLGNFDDITSTYVQKAPTQTPQAPQQGGV